MTTTNKCYKIDLTKEKGETAMKKLIEFLKTTKGGIVFFGVFWTVFIGSAILIFAINDAANKPKYEQGDYPDEKCYLSGCENPVEWKYSRYGMEDFFCNEHYEYGKELYENSTSHKSKTETIEDKYGHDRFDAIVIAKKIVSNNLKSPSTAKFCKNSEYTVKCSGSSWTISGYVDAQNGFGATLRSKFTVGFTFSSSQEYTIVSCVIE